MLAEVNVLAAFGAPYYCLVESLAFADASENVLINTDNIVRFKVQGSSDTFLEYKINRFEDRSPEFLMKIDETNAALTTLADATPASLMITLPVYEGALTFNDVSGLTTTDHLFNVDHIVWGNENNAGTVTRILVAEGGFGLKVYFVDYNIPQIVDVADTGTTTTTTSSTSSSSSTSTSSTSSTSTSSTSTSSTSSTSSYTTSTSTSSTSSTSTSSTSTSSTSSTSTSSTSTSSSSSSSTSTSSTSTSSTSSTTTIA